MAPRPAAPGLQALPIKLRSDLLQREPRPAQVTDDRHRALFDRVRLERLSVRGKLNVIHPIISY